MSEKQARRECSCRGIVVHMTESITNMKDALNHALSRFDF